MTVRTKVERVTPALAAKYLELVNPAKQRGLKRAKVEDYACSMSHGHWVLTHQGIAFDNEGNLCDGQHRMHAVVQSGATIDVLVTRGLEEKQNALFTFDAIDQGVKRHIGEQIQIRHGVDNAFSTAAAVKKIVQLCITRNPVMTVATTMAVLHYFDAEIKKCIPLLRPTAGMCRAPVLGSAAFCLRVGGQAVLAFIAAVGSGENLSRGNPALTFRQHALNTEHRGGGDRRGPMERAFCQCAMHAMMGNSVTRLISTTRGIDFFADKQQKVVLAIRDMFTV